MPTIVKLIIPDSPAFSHCKDWLDHSPDWRSMQVALDLAETKLCETEFEILESYAKSKIARMNSDAVGRRIGRCL